MEYKCEVKDGPGGVPEFGAIFMANNAMKWECFKRKVFSLPSSMADFVKQVKEGMVLFLFEFEKRQLYGVYRATSDGAMNLAPHAFGSWKQFPAQVRFTPIWICSPLFENEFRDAIKENYFSAKKFHFGLSEHQVHRLLKLFSTRKLKDKLPPRQFTRIVSMPADKDRKRVDHEKFAVRERLEMEHFEDDFTPIDLSNCFEDIPDRSIESDDDMLFIDGSRMGSGKKIGPFGQNLLTDQVGDSPHRRSKANVNKADIELYDTRTSLLPYGTNNHELSLDGERLPAACGRFLMAENTNNDCEVYHSLSPAMATKYTVGPYDATKIADYGRPLWEGTNRRIDDESFLMNDTIGSKRNFQHSSRPLIYNEHEENLLERPERSTNDYKSFMNSRLGHKHYIDNNINLFVPSESFRSSLQRVKGTSGDALMGERIASEHNLDNGLGLDSLPEKFGNPFDINRRTIDERRFRKRDKMMKTNYTDGSHGSTTSYVPSGYDTTVPRHVADGCRLSKSSQLDNGPDIETFPQPVSINYATFSHLKKNSLDCFRKPSPDSEFSQLKESQNFKSSNSIYHDSVVLRTVPSAPELPIVHHGHSLSTRGDQGVSLAVDTPVHGPGGDLLSYAKSNSYTREGSGRYDHPDFGNKNFYPTNYDFSQRHTAQIPHSMECISSAPADNWSLQHSPFTSGSVCFRDSHDLHHRKMSPLTFDSHPVLSQRLQKHIDWQAIDERIAGDRVLSSNENLTGFDIYHREGCLKNHGVEFHKSYESDIPSDGGQHCLNPEGVYSDSEKQRKSVFTRLTSTPRVRIREELEKDSDLCRDTSVDEVMNILNSSRDFQVKNCMKFKHVDRQHDRKEMARSEKQISPEHAQSSLPTKMMEEASQAIKEGADEMPKETRAVEFKRRSDLKKGLDEDSTGSNVLAKEDNTFNENTQPEGPENKQQKRRKLVRPVFTRNQNLLSQSQIA